MDLFEALKGSRSVRAYKDEPKHEAPRKEGYVVRV